MTSEVHQSSLDLEKEIEELRAHVREYCTEVRNL